MTDLEQDLAAAAELVAQAPTDDQLSQTRELCLLLLRAHRAEERATEVLAKATANRIRLETGLLPTRLSALGLTKLELDNGALVEVKSFVNPSIDKEQADKAYVWLTEHGLGDLIKNQVTVSFGKGEDEEAGELVKELTADGYEPENKKSVHPQSLGAAIREHLEKGGVVDTPAIKVFTGNVAKVKLPKSTTLKDVLGD
jgi:hypothetical protein